MAVYDLEEQEQLAELKSWWQRYGNRVSSIALVVALAAAGWQGWQWWQRNQAAQASAIYAGVQQAAAQHDAKRARELAGELIDKYAGTAYAGMGALLAARVQVDQGDDKNARLQLSWAAEHAKDAGLRDLARLRLATVLFDAKEYDAALKQLAAEPAPPFAARYADLRGDILATQGKLQEAAAAYDAALAKLDAAAKNEAAPHSEYRAIVQIKRDALGTNP